MRRPKYLESEGRNDRWLISYVDIVTILLILFIAVAAQAVQRPAPRPEPPSTPTKVVPAPVASPPVSPALARAQFALQKDGVDLKLEERGLVISLPQAILFSAGQDAINPAALPTISQIAGVLSEMTNKISLIGHADATPIHSKRFHNNWELSSARSIRLLEFLTTRYPISETRLMIASQGAYNPKSPNDTEDGRAANRRVEIVILSELSSPPPP